MKCREKSDERRRKLGLAEEGRVMLIMSWKQKRALRKEGNRERGSERRNRQKKHPARHVTRKKNILHKKENQRVEKTNKVNERRRESGTEERRGLV